MEGKYRKQAYQLAGIGHWHLNIQEDTLYWSEEIKRLHEVENGFKPTLESAITFYPAGEFRNRIQESVRKAIEDGDKFNVEAKIITAKGNERWVRAIGEPEFRNGKCIRVFGSTQNITKLKKTEEKVLRQQRKLQDIIEHSTIMFYRHDTNHQLTYLSPQSEIFLGCPPEEAMQKWTDFITDHPANKAGIKKTVRAIETGETQPPYELQLKKLNGDIIWVKVNESPLVVNGKTEEIFGSMTDITELKNQQQELNKLSRVASETQNIVIITDSQERIEWVNRAFTNITGYTKQEAMGQNPGELLQGPDTNGQAVAEIAQKLETKESFTQEILNYTKDGQPYWVKMDITPILNESGEITQYFSIQEDITEHKKAIERLSEKESQLRNIANNIDGMIHRYVLHPDGSDEFIFVSDGVNELHEVSPKEVLESPDPLWAQIVVEHRDDVRKSVKKSARLFNTWNHKWRIITPSGKEKWIHGRGTPKKLENGSVSWDTILLDISDQKALEENISRQVTLLNSILDSIPGLFYMVREDLTFQRTNQNLRNFFNLSSDELRQTNALSLIDPDKREQAQESIQEAYHNGFAELNTILIDGNGNKRHFYMNGKSLELQGDRYIIGTGIDITQRVKTEEENYVLLQEVHHRVKNNLAIISGILTLELQEMPDDGANKISLERSINRIHAIGKVHEMLYQSANFSHINVSTYIPELTQTIRATLENGKNIEFRYDIAEDLDININQIIPLGMLLNELLTNSLKYAFKDANGGQISIGIQQNDSSYRVTYRDNGTGFDISDFENSSTLGLTIVNTLLKQLDANYHVDTENGFSIDLSFEEIRRGPHSNIID